MTLNQDGGGMGAGISVDLLVTGESGVDAEELDALGRQLRRQLLELDVDDVRAARSGTDIPFGAKPGELIAAGALVVSLAPVVLPAVLQLLDTWMQNRPVHSIKVERDGRSIELGDATPEERQRLIDDFLNGSGTHSDGE
ncbi:hypothetical protein [Streptomyces sp. NPDC101165]|uniref:hypothetical protein n=1 Tax=Streptomyces sp. NPDC101165 TaxID=3366119 RepID=UPI0037F733C5